VLEISNKDIKNCLKLVISKESYLLMYVCPCISHNT